MPTTDYMTLSMEETTVNADETLNRLLIDEAQGSPRETSAIPRVRSSEIRRIAEWVPTRTPSLPPGKDDAQAALEARRLRPGGDVSLAENDYRDGYRSWRLGLANGAVTTSGGAAGCHEGVRRVAAAAREAAREAGPSGVAEGNLPFPVRIEPETGRGTKKYWWRYTLAYWVACTFIVGSALFTFGAGFDYYMPKVKIPQDRLRIRKSATVLWPYFVGGLFFVVGGYLGYHQAINLGVGEDEARKMRRFVLPRRGADGAWRLDIDPRVWHSHYGYLSYTVGACVFQLGIAVEIAVANGYAHWSPGLDWVYFFSGFGGGVLFVVGASFAVDHNESWRPTLASEELVWWIANCNFLGSLLFLLAGVFLAPGAMVALGVTDAVAVQLPYFAGSFLFLVASVCELFMWRVDHHGLAFVRAINVARRDMSEESGVSLNQLGFVVITVCTYSLSLMDLVFAFHLSTCKNQSEALAYYDIYDSGLMSLFCFGALVLASVVHTIPKQRPFGMLFWLLRLAMGLLLVRYFVKLVLSWSESRRCQHWTVGDDDYATPPEFYYDSR